MKYRITNKKVEVLCYLFHYKRIKHRAVLSFKVCGKSVKYG